MARDIESLLRQQAALSTFGSFAFRETNLATVLREAARICAECLDVGHSKICRYRPQSGDLLIEAAFGWEPDVAGKVVSASDENSPQGRAFTTGKPVIIKNLEDATGYSPPDFYKDHGIVSTVDVLIQAHAGSPFGVLEVDSVVERSYEEHDINFLTGFANVLAEAVATSNRNEVLKVAIAEMTIIVAEKDRLLAERDLLAMELQHRVRNNLQLISDMVISQLRETSDVKNSKGLEGIIRQIMTLAQVYEHLLGSGMTGRIDLGGYVSALCANLQDLQPPHPFPTELRCDAEPLPVTLASATALGLAVTELISNSFEHGYPDRAGTVRVSVKRGQADQGVVIVTDDGVGYAPGSETRRHGVGLVRRLVQQVGGALDVVGGSGTVWTLRFPLADDTNAISI